VAENKVYMVKIQNLSFGLFVSVLKAHVKFDGVRGNSRKPLIL